MIRSRLFAVCALVLGLGAGSASANTIYTFDISGLETNLGFAGAFPTLIHDFGIAGTITRVDFDVNYESFAPSWRSEVAIAIDTIDDFSIDGDIFLDEFGAPNSAGFFAASGFVTASSFSSDGLIFLTLWETFNDGSVNPDALFGANSTVTVTFAAIPEPSSIVLVGLGVLGVGGAALRRRRRSAAA